MRATFFRPLLRAATGPGSARLVPNVRVLAKRMSAAKPGEPTISDVLARLEAMDTRLEAMDTRLEAMDTRLETMDTRLDSKFGMLFEKAKRSEIASEFGPSYSLHFEVKDVYDLVLACTQEGCVLPKEVGLSTVNAGLMRGHAMQLTESRASSVINLVFSLRSHLKQKTEQLRLYVDKIAADTTKNVQGPRLLLDSVTKGLEEWDAMDKRSSPEKAAFLRYRPDLLVAALTSFSWEWDPKCPAGRLPFQNVLTIDVRGSVKHVPLDHGSQVLIQIEAGEIKSNADGKTAVQQLARVFGVLELILTAISAGPKAKWEDGKVVSQTGGADTSGDVGSNSRSMLDVDANGIAYMFLGRVFTDTPVSMNDSWETTASTGVRFLQPRRVRFVSS